MIYDKSICIENAWTDTQHSVKQWLLPSNGVKCEGKKGHWCYTLYDLVGFWFFFYKENVLLKNMNNNNIFKRKIILVWRLAVQNKTLLILVFEVKVGHNQPTFSLSACPNMLENIACPHSWSDGTHSSICIMFI